MTTKETICDDFEERGLEKPKSEEVEPQSDNHGRTGRVPPTIELPQKFSVKYLGFREAKGVWGIKCTRSPVEQMVTEARKNMRIAPEQALPLLKLEVTEEGLLVGPSPQNNNPNYPSGRFAIENISYGVQDILYTRVFAMIVVRPDIHGKVSLNDGQPAATNKKDNSTTGIYRCHAFLCDGRTAARKLTYALASSFEKFRKTKNSGVDSSKKVKERFTVDLRSPEVLQAELEVDDSEA